VYEYVITEVKGNEELQLIVSETRQLLVYANYVSLLTDNVNTVKRKLEALWS
jgi:hypothetical protein